MTVVQALCARTGTVTDNGLVPPNQIQINGHWIEFSYLPEHAHQLCPCYSYALPDSSRAPACIDANQFHTFDRMVNQNLIYHWQQHFNQCACMAVSATRKLLHTLPWTSIHQTQLTNDVDIDQGAHKHVGTVWNIMMSQMTFTFKNCGNRWSDLPLTKIWIQHVKLIDNIYLQKKKIETKTHPLTHLILHPKHT